MNQSSHFPSLQINTTTSSSSKRKRRPAGTPDSDAEVVSLSPRTLLESDRYVCEICNQGFQRDQNLQMHRRRHKVPWKLVKREGPASQIKKRVFVCPEPSCLHHDPGHALGDLVGIKKHFRRKHSDQRQWVCERCNKGYAVQSDYKAHLKTCGTRGHSCDCGRVFSRVESFIEHQDKCNTSNTTSPSPSSDLIPSPKMPHNLELQLLPASITNHSIEIEPSSSQPDDEIRLQLSIGCNTTIQIKKANKDHLTQVEQHAKRQVEIAEQELENAKSMRQKALLELNKAYAIRDQAIRQINATLLQITCCACKQKFRSKPTVGINLDDDQNKLMNEELG